MDQTSPLRNEHDSPSVPYFGDFMPSFFHHPAPSRVGIMGALPQEVKAITSALENPTLADQPSGSYVTGHIGDIPVVVTQSGLGKVNAALTAQRLISDYQASALIYTGTTDEARRLTGGTVEGTSINPRTYLPSEDGEGAAVASVCEHNRVPSIHLGPCGKYGLEAKTDSGKSFFAEALNTAQFVMNLLRDEGFGSYLKRVVLN